MKPFYKGLDTETQLLVALGSAVASGCIPCLESITGLARTERIDEKKMRAAAIIQDLLTLARRGNYTATPIDLCSRRTSRGSCPS